MLLETFRTLNDFKRKANKQKFAYMLKSTWSVTWYPWQQYNRSNLVSNSENRVCRSHEKFLLWTKQCGDKTYLLRSSSLSCALKFASLVACWYSAVEHLWIWLSEGVFRRSLSLEVWSLNSDYLLSWKVQIKVYALSVYHFRCQLLAFVFTYIIKYVTFSLCLH